MKLTGIVKMTEAEQLDKMRIALQRIAFMRKSEYGGNLSRRDMIQIARVALLECTFGWPKRGGGDVKKGEVL